MLGPSSTADCNFFYIPTVYTPNAHMDRLRVEHFLPLTPIAFEILLALADGEQHGYRIMQEVNSRSGGAVTLHAGTLYRALARLLEQALIEELAERPAEDDERRRYYRITRFGSSVASAEAARLAELVADARARKLLKGRA